MAAKGKKVRLFKIAAELNVGKDSIVSFLRSKGYEIEEKATAVLTPEMVVLVREAFATEFRKAKRLRQEASEAQVRQETVLEEVVAEAASKKATVEEPKEPQHAGDAAAAAAEEAVSGEKEETTPVAETVPIVEPKILGKIDLEALEQKPKAKKQAQKKAEKSKKAAEKKKKKAVARKKKEKEQLKTEAQQEPASAQPVTSGVEGEQQSVEMPSVVEETKSFSPRKKGLEDLQQLLSKVEEAEDTEERKLDMERVESTESASDLVLTAPVAADHLEIEQAALEGETKATDAGEEEVERIELEDSLPGTTLRVLGKIDLEEYERKERRRSKKKRRAEAEEEAAEAAEEVVATDETDAGLKESPEHPHVAPDMAPVRFRKRRKKGRQRKVDQEDVERTVKKTLQEMAAGGETALEERRRLRKQRKKQRKEEALQRQEEEKRLEKLIEIPEFITVAELADVLGISPNQIILKCMELGLVVSINQRLDRDVISLIAEDMGFEVRFVEEPFEDVVEEEGEEQPEDLQPRPPVVTIMGHVDHGKTSLLDYIRQSNIVAGEAGGITQHIGAYKVTLPHAPEKSITFLDTPGHEAFTAMRARGAQVTDIVVLVVAADDRVMPQTEEAISHARVAGVPIVVAINKIDKPEANPDLIKQQLAERGVLVEEWGGDVPCVEVSAKTGQGVEQLLETILLVAELQELKANPKRKAKGTVIEAKLDRGKGPVATVLIQQGTLHEGEIFVCGSTFGRVRAMFDERGHRVEAAGPSTPVQVLGFDEVPEAGDSFVVVDSEAKAREIARQRQILKREKLLHRRSQMSFENLASLIQEKAIRELPIVLKADVVGSLEALTEALHKLSTDEVAVNIIHKGIGAISESDVMLAAASNAVVLGFHVRPTAAAKQAAEREGVEIRIYRVIYECIDEVKQALEGMLQPEQKEEVVGMAEVREIFRIRKVGTVAGCYVQEGVIHRNDLVRLVRDGIEIFEGKIRSLRRHKEDVREVKAGYECGILLDGFNDVQVGDIIEAVQIVEVKRSLESITS